MSSATWLYIWLLITIAILLFGAVYFVIMLTDLECDYINPIDLANSLNKYVMPEMLIYLATVFFLMLYGQWISLLINLPLAVWNITKLVNNKQYYDATEVFRTLSKHKRESFLKVGFYLLCFFYYLYCMIVYLIGDAGEAYNVTNA